MKQRAVRLTDYLSDLLVGLCMLAAIAAALGGDAKAASAFAVVAAVNAWFLWQHDKKAASLGYRLKELFLPGRMLPTERAFASPLRRELRLKTTRMVAVGTILELFLVMAGQTAGFTVDTGLTFGLAILAALLPVGLIYELSVVTACAAATKAAHITAKVIRCALDDNLAALLLVVVSLLGMLAWHVPLAINAVQILAINAVLMAAPLAATAWDTRPPSPLAHVGTGKLLSFGITAALLSYANFLLFFARSSLSPRYVDLSSPYLFKASSIALLTLLLCQALNLLLVRADEHDSFFTNYLKSNHDLLYAFGLSFFLLLNMLYNPFVRPYFGTGPLSLLDWLAAIAAASVYLGLRLFQRHTRKHTRQMVLELHKKQALS